MRRNDPQQAAMFRYISPEERIPEDHPLRALRAIVDAVLKELSPQFDRLYSLRTGPRLPRKSYCGRSCSRCSTRFAGNGC
jgi:hypothetical protein